MKRFHLSKTGDGKFLLVVKTGRRISVQEYRSYPANAVNILANCGWKKE